MEVQRLAGDSAIADTTSNVPHPYEDGLAERWIQSHAPKYESGELATFAVIRNSDEVLIGTVGLTLTKQFRRGELGYWVGTPFWNQGYCTEAAESIIRFAFSTLNLHKIEAYHLASNPASGRVLQKLGMTKEGLLRDHASRSGQFEDLVVYGLLATDTKSWH